MWKLLTSCHHDMFNLLTLFMRKLPVASVMCAFTIESHPQCQPPSKRATKEMCECTSGHSLQAWQEWTFIAGPRITSENPNRDSTCSTSSNIKDCGSFWNHTLYFRYQLYRGMGPWSHWLPHELRPAGTLYFYTPCSLLCLPHREMFLW